MSPERVAELAQSLAAQIGQTGIPHREEYILAALAECERIVREECARVCEAEYVDAEATGTAEDKAYNCAIEHCAAAIREGK